MSGSTARSPHQAATSLTRGPVLWLILTGVLVVAAITIDIAIIVGQFRERAISNSERELQTTVLLLTRHFDQQFADSDIIATDLIAKMQFEGSASPEIFKSRMSTWDAHLLLKSKASALSYIGDVNIFDANGKLINSSGAWPLPDLDIAERDYFKALKSDPRSKIIMTEPERRDFTGNVTTMVIAGRLMGWF